jgi:hypothetical protein
MSIECGGITPRVVSPIKHPSAETFAEALEPDFACGHAFKTVLAWELKGSTAHAACVSR